MRKLIAALCGVAATVMSVYAQTQVPVFELGEKTRETATWMGSCDNATIWALVAMICFAVAAWKDTQHRLLVKELIADKVKATEAAVNQAEAYKNMVEAMKAFREVVGHD